MSNTNTSREKIEKKSTLSTLIAVEKADILFALFDIPHPLTVQRIIFKCREGKKIFKTFHII
jgi:hypothetical protein